MNKFLSSKLLYAKSVIVTLLIAVTPALNAAEKYALVFGTNYKGSEISPLDLCERDAEKMKSQIVKTGSFKNENVRVFLGNQVTRDNLRKSLVDWLGKVVKADDQVFFYFAGHGQFVRDAAAKNGMRNYVVMYNRPHVSDDELSDWFKAIRTKKAVIILDCCFSGGIAKKGQATRGAAGVPVPADKDYTVLQDLEGVHFQNKVVISSADDNETAIELGPPVNHGIFTYYFSEAILNADLNNDQAITAYEAFFKARNDTSKMASKVSHKQNPQISGDASGFLFKGVPSKPVDPDVKPLPPVPVVIVDPKPEPPISPQEPVNDDNKKSGILVLQTTYRKSSLKGSMPQVFVDADEYDYKSKWTNDPDWGNVLTLELKEIPSGVHNITLKAKGYSDTIVKTGIEPNKVTTEKVVCGTKGKGSVIGKVWVETFDRPVNGILVLMKPIPNVERASVTTRKDGSFVFYDIKPGKYTLFLRGGVTFTKPYDKEITIAPDTVTNLDVVLKEYYKNIFDKKK